MYSIRSQSVQILSFCVAKFVPSQNHKCKIILGCINDSVVLTTGVPRAKPLFTRCVFVGYRELSLPNTALLLFGFDLKRKKSRTKLQETEED